jgi:hypothetical protein
MVERLKKTEPEVFLPREARTSEGKGKIKSITSRMKTRIKPNISPPAIAMALFCGVAVLASTDTIPIRETKSQAPAVLRPHFPVKPAPPFGGEVIGDDLILGSAKEHQLKYRGDKGSRV